ncbi:MAG: PKD domain-containing protein [Bacteroidia bacterium]
MRKFIFSFFLLSLLLPNLGLQAQIPCFFQGNDQNWDTRFAQPGARGANIQALVESQDGSLIIAASGGARFGGDPNMSGIARWDGEKYSPIGQGMYGVSLVPVIYAAVEDANGNLYLGGNFTGARNADGTQVPSRNIIRFNVSTQQWEAIGSGLQGLVYALAVDQDTLYIGGAITATQDVNPIPLNKIARYYLNTATWDSLGGGVGRTLGSSFLSGNVEALKLTPSGELIVGGSIDYADTLSINSIARWTPGIGWDNMGGGLPSFRIDASGVPNGLSYPSTVQSIEYNPTNGEIYAGGYFGEFIGSASVIQIKGLAKWNGTTWTLIPGIGLPVSGSAASVHALKLDVANQKLYVGGTFSKDFGNLPGNIAAGNGIMQYDLATNTWDDLIGGIRSSSGGPGGTVQDIALYQGSVYAAGNFTKRTPDGEFCHSLIAWDGQDWDNLGDGIHDAGQIYEMTSYNGELIVSGNFSKIDNKEIPRIAKWNPTTAWDTIAPGLFGNNTSNYGAYAYALHVQGPELYIGGQFGGAGSVTSTGILRYNMIAKTWTSWGTGLGGVNTPRVYDFVEFQGEIYMAGYFTEINGVPITYLAKLTANGWVSIGDFNNPVLSLANAGDSILYIAGNFTQVDGNSNIKKVAQYDGSTVAAVGQGVIGGQVYKVAIDPLTGHAYFGGSISNCRQSDGSTVLVSRLAKWDGMQWSQGDAFANDQGFNAIRDMEFAADGTLYLGGDFTTIKGETVNHIARWNPTYGIAGFGQGFNRLNTGGNIIAKIMLADSSMYVGGNFYSAGAGQSTGIARYLLKDDPLAGQISVKLGPDTTSCGTLTLDAGNAGANFVWNTGDQSQSLMVSQTGWYAVTVFDGNCSDQDSIYVTISMPAPVFTADTIADCNEILIDAGSGYLSYLWNTGDTTQTTTANDGGLITITVLDSAGCSVIDTIYANIIGYDPNADFSSIMQPDSSISFDASASFDAITYSWDFGDGTQAIGMMASHTYTSNDSFLVTLIVSNDCGNDTTMETVVVDFLTSLEVPLALRQLKLFPNPASTYLELTADLGAVQDLELILVDLQGRPLFAERLNVPGGRLQHRLSISAIEPGIYFLQIKTELGNITHKLIITD